MRDDNPYKLFKHRYLPVTSLFLQKLNYLEILLIIGSSGSRFGVLKNQSRVSMSTPMSIEWLHLSRVQYVVLGPRKSAMPLVRDFSENDEIFRREKKYVE